MQIRRTAAVITAAAALSTSAAFASPAMAATAVQDGLVNVAVGDVNVLNNANVGVAAQVIAQVCGVKVGPVAVLGRAVDRTGVTRTVCTTDGGPVTVSQNQ